MRRIFSATLGRRPRDQHCKLSERTLAGFVDWQAINVGRRRIVLERAGMGVTLNGIAQGYITDRVMDILACVNGCDRTFGNMGLQQKYARSAVTALDVPAQRRGRRDAQDIIETIGSTPVEDFGTAIMAIGAQQYLGVGPVGPDRPQQAAQEGTDLLATRPFGGAKHSCDEAAFAVEHDNRLETVFVVKCRTAIILQTR